MSILVTGGAGYIGSHVVEQLVERGYDVVVFDNFQAGHRAALSPRAHLIEGDLLDAASVRAVFNRYDFDGILHFASRIQVGESMQNPFLYLRDNVHASENLIEAAVEFGVQRFILSSTANLFDKPTRIPINEDEPIIPGSVYGETKAYAERLLYWMDRIYGLRYCALRYFNASGAHPNGHIGEDHHPETHLIPIVLQVAMGQRTHVDVFGDDYPTPDGTAIRDYIHIIDLADAHILALEALKEGPSRVYNLGSGRGYSVMEVIETARKVTGHPIPVRMAPRRAGDASALVADNTKITAELGWYPEYNSLEAIIQTAWAWHQSHPHGYEDQ
ncbi:MAG: UDP-glucose 4-epimerase GalE [Anaerolineae bacterium]